MTSVAACNRFLPVRRSLQFALLSLVLLGRSAREYKKLLDASATSTTIKKKHQPNTETSSSSLLRGGAATTTTNNHASIIRPVHWLTVKDAPDLVDFFSASWYMNVPRFRQMNVSGDNIANVEAGCFGSFYGREHLLRMSLDWLDFSVEHMSQWWRRLGCPGDSDAYNVTTNMFSSYIDQHTKNQAAPFEDSSLLHPTLAMIAFQQYRSDDSGREPRPLSKKDHRVTTTALGATLASLVQVGMGRILVVGHEPSDEAVVLDAFRLLLDENYQTNKEGESLVGVVHGSQLVYVRATDDLVWSKHVKVNMPRAALAGLMHAYNGTDSTWTQQWLGDDPTYWRYVYLTEPDTILHTRPSTLRHLQQALDEGLILTPHRFQPIPHQGDAPHSSVPHLVPLDFKTPLLLHSGGDNVEEDDNVFQSCCDAQEGDYKPGMVNWEQEHCGTVWWQCGSLRGNHSRLEPYELIRLSHGTGIVTLAGTEHARRCFPRRSPCRYDKKSSRA